MTLRAEHTATSTNSEDTRATLWTIATLLLQGRHRFDRLWIAGMRGIFGIPLDFTTVWACINIANTTLISSA